jgi:hypothetical protein
MQGEIDATEKHKENYYGFNIYIIEYAHTAVVRGKSACGDCGKCMANRIE